MATPPHTQSSRVIEITPFFYGWIILIVGAIGSVMMAPSQTFTVGIFIDSFVTDLGISRANVSLIYGGATFAAALLLPLNGRLLDRYGPRQMVMIVAFLLGLMTMSVSLSQGIITVFLALMGIRLFGFGALNLVSTHAIAQWFIRQRGLVMGLAGQSVAVSLLIFPWLAHMLITEFGWRWAWVLMGLLIWLVMLPLGWLFFRDTPEQYGLLPDGDTDTSEAALLLPGYANEENWTLEEARRTLMFWIFAAALATITLALSGLVFHQVSLFAERGLPQDVAIRAFQIAALFSVIGNLSMGRLLDKFYPRMLLSGLLMLLATAIILVQIMSSPVVAFIYAACVGLVTGGYRVMDGVVWAKYFGRKHLGSIRGATMMWVVGATSFGTYPLGFSLDYLGGYGYALNLILLLPLSLGLIAPFMHPPSK